MTEDLRRLAEQLASGELIAPQVSMEDVCAFAADYLRSLDEGERLREAMKRIKQRAEAVTTDEQFDAALTEIVHLAALSPQEPRADTDSRGAGMNKRYLRRTVGQDE